ncbi:MAG: ribonuclease H [Desulfobacterales bacterium]
MTPTEKSEPARWVRMRFKKNKVWVAADAGERPLQAGGLALIKYQLDQDQDYRVRADALRPLEEKPPDPPPPLPKPARRSAITAADHDPRCVHIFTDGASSGNPGPSGIGVVLLHGAHRKEIAEYIGIATNNIAELTAIQQGLAALKKKDIPVRVYTDSSYAHGVLTLNWKAKKNQDLIAAIRREMQAFSDLKLIKVEGHRGVEENERADRLAVNAIRDAARPR